MFAHPLSCVKISMTSASTEVSWVLFIVFAGNRACVGEQNWQMSICCKDGSTAPGEADSMMW
eukprot:276373-Rhodomonas_salina.2